MGFFLAAISVFQSCTVPTSCQRFLGTATFWIYLIFINLHTTTLHREHNKTYKYLGINEANGISNAIDKEKILKYFYGRIRVILRTEMSAKDKAREINILQIPVVK